MNPNSNQTKITLLLVSSLTVMSGATIAPALPAIQNFFAGVEHVSFWVRFVLTIPALFIVISAPVAGMIADRWGRRRLLLPGLILYAVAGSSGLYLDSLGAIFTGRALLGVAVAGLMTTATTLIADYYEGPARAKFMGWQAAFMSFGGMIFLTGGGLLAEVSWRWPFSVYLFAVVLIPAALVALPEPDSWNSVKDKPGTNNADSPLPWKMLGFIYSVLLFGSTVFYIVPLQIPFYIENQLGAGPSASGMAIAISTLFGVVTSFSYGRIRARMGYVAILGLTFGLMGAGYLLIGTASTFTGILSGLALCGLGMGLMYPNLNLWLTSETPVAVRARAVSGFTTAVFLGQFISPLVSQPLADSFNLETLFWSTGGFLVITSLTIVLLRRWILAFTTQTGQESVPGKDSMIPERAEQNGLPSGSGAANNKTIPQPQIFHKGEE